MERLRFLVIDFIGREQSDFIHSLAKWREGKDYKLSSMRSHTLSLADLQKLNEETQDGDFELVLNAFWGPQKSKYATHESDYWEFDVDNDLRMQFWHMPTEPLIKEGLPSEYINNYIDLFSDWANYYIFIIPVQKPDLFPQIKTLVNVMTDNFDPPTLFIVADNHQTDLDDQILHDNLDLPTHFLIQKCNISEPELADKVLLDFCYFILHILEGDNNIASSYGET